MFFLFRKILCGEVLFDCVNGYSWKTNLTDKELDAVVVCEFQTQLAMVLIIFLLGF